MQVLVQQHQLYCPTIYTACSILNLDLTLVTLLGWVFASLLQLGCSAQSNEWKKYLYSSDTTLVSNIYTPHIQVSTCILFMQTVQPNSRQPDALPNRQPYIQSN